MVQRKNDKHDNPDVECGNVNAKTMRKFIVSTCSKDTMLLTSCDDKCIVNVGTPDNTLALVLKSNAGWKSKSVEVKDADNEMFIKSNVAPSTMLIRDVPND